MWSILSPMSIECRVCGSEMVRAQTDLPFKVSEATIVVVEALPVLECQRCAEYTLEDPVMEQVDEVLRQGEVSSEPKIVRFGA